jgi:fructokinase
MTLASPSPASALPAIGVDLGGTKIEAIVLAPGGASLWRERVATPAGDYGAILSTVANLVARAEAELGLAGCSVGIGTPGTSTHAGLIKNANSTCLNGQPLAHDLAQALGRPVRTANDANCLALSEATDGAAAGAPVVFAVILGTGVGAGVVVNGALLSGPNGLAGEWGHNPLPWGADDEPRRDCYCGLRGCIETLVSGPGLAWDHAQRHGGTLSAEQVAAAAAAGDAAAAATLARHTERLARALASVINLLDPDVIVLGGGVSRMAHLYQQVPMLWDHWIVSGGVRETVRTKLLPSRHGDASGVRGAAWLGRG